MKPLVALSIAFAIAASQPAPAPAIAGTPKGPPHPIDVVLMVDVSASITRGAFKSDASLITDVASALSSVMVAGDTARIGTFGTEVRLDAAALKDPDAVHKAARALTDTIGGASPLWDALDASALVLSTAGPRRGIIVLTDGRSSANRIAFGDMLTKIEHARVAVFAIGLESGGAPVPDPKARLAYLADVTGGTYQPAKRKDVEAAVKQAIAALRASGPSTLIKDHLTGGASRLAALLLPHILPVCSVVAPCHPGAALRDLVPVQRGRATTATTR